MIKIKNRNLLRRKRKSNKASAMRDIAEVRYAFNRLSSGLDIDDLTRLNLLVIGGRIASGMEKMSRVIQ